LSHILLFRTNVFCRIAIRHARILSRGRVDRSRPSIVIEPDSSSIRRIIESRRVDFPLHVEFQYFAKLHFGRAGLASSSTINSSYLLAA
jgi:hypothetical protein